MQQKGVIQVLLTVILPIGIIAGVYLVQKTQIFNSKAFATINTFYNMSGANGYLTPDVQSAWQDMGIGWARTPVSWHTVEPTQGDFDFKRGQWGINTEETIARASSSGVQTVIILGYTASWASTNPTIEEQWDGSYYPPRNVTDWENYVEKVVSHYSQAPYNVHHYEIWNEQNVNTFEPLSQFWHGTKEQFVDTIYIPAARIVRNHEAKVVFGGWAATRVGPYDIDMLGEWLNYNNAWQYTDYIGIHYRGVNAISDLYDRWVANGKTQGIWVTEYGYNPREYFIPNYIFPILSWAVKQPPDISEKYKIFYYGMPTFNGENATRDRNLLAGGSPLEPIHPHGNALKTIKIRNLLTGPLLPYLGQINTTGSVQSYAIESGNKIVILLTDGIEEETGNTPGIVSVTLPKLTGVAKVSSIDVHTAQEISLAFTQNRNNLDFEVNMNKHALYIQIETSEETSGEPTVKANVTATPTSVSYNGSSTITWSSSGIITTCTDPFGGSTQNGSQSTGNLTATTNYSFSCTGPGGTSNSSATVTVGAPPPSGSTGKYQYNVTIDPLTSRVISYILWADLENNKDPDRLDPSCGAPPAGYNYCVKPDF